MYIHLCHTFYRLSTKQFIKILVDTCLIHPSSVLFYLLVRTAVICNQYVKGTTICFHSNLIPFRAGSVYKAAYNGAIRYIPDVPFLTSDVTS